MARTRYRSQEQIPLTKLPGAALRAVLDEGYSFAQLRADALAGLVVGVVALPLSMALAIAVGAKPEQGLYTAIVCGFVAAARGGSRTQVNGPTAAFVVILAPIVAQFGMPGLLTAGLGAGLLLIMFGLFRAGRLIEFIPHPVTTGFTAGIGTVIAAIELKDFFGLSLAQTPDHFFDRVAAMFAARATLDPCELSVGVATLALLLLLPRLTKRLPAPVIALPLAALLAVAAHVLWPSFSPSTIATRFHSSLGGVIVAGIPRALPVPVLPWSSLDFASLRALLPAAFAIAMLGAIESLLSAVISDGMAHTRHDPDAELLALGVGNVLVPFFGGIPATGAIARTATNIRAGGRTPFAAMLHALTVLLSMLILAPAIGYLPMASLAALLLVVAWNMSDVPHFFRIVRIAPASDVAVLLVCYGLTITFDMVVAVSVGVLLAAVLFMRRMANMTAVQVLVPPPVDAPGALPEGFFVYDFDGPLLFGAAQKAMSQLDIVSDRARVIILRLDHVPFIDATGLVALESALVRVHERGRFAIVSGLPAAARALVAQSIAGVTLANDYAEALRVGGEWLKTHSA